MAAVAFDSLEYAHQLEAAGMPRAQAEVIAQGLRSMFVHNGHHCLLRERRLSITNKIKETRNNLIFRHVYYARGLRHPSYGQQTIFFASFNCTVRFRTFFVNLTRENLLRLKLVTSVQ